MTAIFTPPTVPKPAIIAQEPAIALVVSLYETFSTFQLNRPYNGGDLVDHLGEFLRDRRRRANRLIKDQPDAPGVRVLRSLYREFEDVVNGSDDGINGGDLVERFGEWLSKSHPAMVKLLGDPFLPKVLRNPDGDFFTPDDGWQEDIEEAFAFFFHLPEPEADEYVPSWEVVDLGQAREGLEQVETRSSRPRW